MALPTAYLTSTKNLGSIFDAIREAKAPEKFTTRFLESLDFKSTADRLVIGVLKGLNFLDAEGRPLDRYFRFLDQTQSGAVLAEAIEAAYADLFQTNKTAQNLSRQEIINKLKTLSQGQLSESVLDKVASTFLSLCKLADFTAKPNPSATPAAISPNEVQKTHTSEKITPPSVRTLGGLHYNIQIILPETRDPKIYDALFRSLKEHLLS